MGPFIDYTVNGLVVGNIYALLAIGLALIFGVANLINFAHGSVYTIGAYVGWACITFLGTPLPLTFAAVLLATALRLALRSSGSPSGRCRGAAASRRCSRPSASASCSTSSCNLFCKPEPRALPSPLPDWRIAIGGGSIGALDMLIAGIGIVQRRAAVQAFLRYTKLGWAVRATAQDPEAARQMGVDTDAVNSTVFAIASALGGLSGLLVGMYYNRIDPSMSFNAMLKGIVATVIGGIGNVPGAIFGSLLLGLTESYGIALFGATYRDLFAFVLLIAALVLRPNGLFGWSGVHSEPLTGTFLAPSPSAPRLRARRLGARRRRRGAAARLCAALSAADADQRLACGDARAEPDADRGHGRADLARTGGAARDRRLCLGAAVARPRPVRSFITIPSRAH